MQPRLIYITTKDVAEAQAIGRTLIERRLAACVNILPGMQSLYRWEGKIESATEAVLIAKTDARLASKVVDAVKELHSYTVPCALELPVLSGHQPYLDWLAAETSS